MNPESFNQLKILNLPLISKPIFCTEHTSVKEAVNEMIKNKIGSIIVNDHQQRTIGIFTERDFLIKSPNLSSKELEKPISQLMTPKPKTVTLDSNLHMAFGLMRLGKFRHLIVVNESDQCIGVISIKDAFDFVCDYMQGESA